NAEVDGLIERESRITELLKIINTQDIETSNPNALASAIYLLGQYRAVEAICPLLKHLTFRPANSERWITHTVPEPETYPAVTALIAIGSTPVSKSYLTYRVMESKNLLQRNLTAYVLSQLIGKEA